MARRISAALGATILLGAAPAAADPCMCVVVDELGSARWAPQSEVGETISRPLDEITSFEVTRVEARAPEGPEKLLWCDDDDSPRCRRGNDRRGLTELPSPPPALTAFEGAKAPRKDGASYPRPSASEDPPSGQRNRVERPPRR